MVAIAASACRTWAAEGESGVFGFGEKGLSASLSAADGKLLSVQVGAELVGATPGDAMCLDLRVNDRWLVGQEHQAARLVSRESRGNELTLVQRVGEVAVVQHLTLDPEHRRLARRFEITNRGTETVRLGGFWFASLGLNGGAGALYSLPRTYPPQRREFAALTPGSTRGTGEKLAPVLVQLSPTRSVAFMADSRTDHVSAGVQERAGGVTVTQAFNVLGWLKPGQTFTDIGTAYVQLIEGNYDDALHALWGWMGDVGLVVPKDRADWFSDAVLYSFHPGGTIGSQFSDLGGFKAATDKLLPRLPRGGATALWMLPVEDQSPYQPRDYYKFQAGLGTPEEFGALVKRAHELGLHVLMDCVPHGGTNTNDRAKEHPEWLARDLNGKSLSYWCFDFNQPGWQQYMAGVASYYVRQYDVDGYRVDACSGSKIPNWSKDIPYQRASLAQLQGGLGMLGSVRGAVRALKPRVGGLLAETEGAPYATTADAVYDFTFCNSILHDWRNSPPDVFVRRTRTWLEEQQYTDPQGTIHLRHVENHDTLRGQGWFGVRGMRTVAALMAWIHGMPMIYDHEEVGHEDALRQIYDIRALLPELRRGEAHYVAVGATPGEVFAFLRRDGARASLVALNFGPNAVHAKLTWDADKWLTGRSKLCVYDAMQGRLVSEGQSVAQLRTLSLDLPALGYTVLAIRDAAQRGELPPDASRPKPLGVGSLRLAKSAGPAPLPLLLLDNQRPVLELTDLLLPTACRPTDARASALSTPATQVPNYPVTQLPLASGSARLEPTPSPTGVSFRAHLVNVPIGTAAGLVLRVPNATHYQVRTTDGVLSSSVFPVCRSAAGTYGSIYWRPQGTSALFDSRLTPLAETDGWLTFRGDGVREFALRFPQTDRLPAVVQLHDRYGDQQGLFVLLHWRLDGLRADDFTFEVTSALPAAGAETAEPKMGSLTVRQVGPWWIAENAYYRLTLHKSGGVIRELIDKPHPEQPVISSGAFYTDRGLCITRDGGRQRTSAEYDVESAVQVRREGARVRLRFEGQFRGQYRFDKASPPLRFYTEYVFDDGPTFRHTWGWESDRGLTKEDGFLAQMWAVDSWDQFRCANGGKVILQGERGEKPGRVGETKRLTPPLTPAHLEVLAKGQPLLRLDEIATNGPAPLRNVFFDGHNFFLASLDGADETCLRNRWYEASALLTVGSAKPEALPLDAWQAAGTAPERTGSLVRDGSFEQSGSSNLVSYRTGERVPWPATGLVWDAPAGGTFTSETNHGGGTCAKVVNTSGDYLLFRQPVTLDLAPGKKYRLTAWVRGENLVRGVDAWRTGSVRLAFTTPTGQHYAQVAELLGTFDWKLAAGVVEVPAGASSAEVQVGVNGGTGTMWIDEVTVAAE